MSENGKNGAPPEPESTGGQDYDPKTGKFLPGNKIGLLGGRPVKPDFELLARQAAKAQGKTVDEVYIEIIQTVWNAAIAGDMQAVKLALDRRLGAVDKIAVDINVDARSVNITQPPSDAKLIELAEHLLKLTNGNPG